MLVAGAWVFQQELLQELVISFGQVYVAAQDMLLQMGSCRCCLSMHAVC